MEKIDVTMNKTLSATNTSHLERKKGAQKRKKTLQIKLWERKMNFYVQYDFQKGDFLHK